MKIVYFTQLLGMALGLSQRKVGVHENMSESRQFLREKGLDAISYRTGDHLRAALETARFDGFILDWMLGDGTIRELLAEVRAKNPNGPVIILTGQIEAGGAQEDDLAATISAYRAQLYEKPTRMLSLFNALELGFEASPRST